MTPQPGRPTTGKQISPKVPQRDIERLDTLAAENGTTRNAEIRQAITNHLTTQHTLNQPTLTPSTLATDLARIHASIVRLEQETDGPTEPEWLDLYGAKTTDMAPLLSLAETLEETPDAIPQILTAYQDALNVPLREAEAAYAAQPQDDTSKARMASLKLKGWQRKQEELVIDPTAGTITFRWRRSTDITLRWEAPGQVSVVSMDDHYPGLVLGWWLLLTDRVSAQEMMARVADREVTRDYLNDYTILKDAPEALDWLACIDDYCHLGGRALTAAVQNLAQWAPDIEVNRPRRVRMYQVAQARQMAAAGIRPVLATPSLYTVVVCSELDAIQQGVEYYPVPQELLELELQAREGQERFAAASAASRLTEMVRGGYGHKPEAQGSARYTAAYVRAWKGPKVKVEVVTGKESVWDAAGKRRVWEEFPDKRFPGAGMLAGLAYPGAYLNAPPRRRD